jgi:hypothetical protein
MQSVENERTTMRNSTGSFRHFPLDLLMLSGLPIILSMALMQSLLSLRGWPWVIAYSCALLVAIIGAALLFRAKLPLYRQRRFFTFGSRHLPADSLPLYRLALRFCLVGFSAAIVLLLLSLPWMHWSVISQ